MIFNSKKAARVLLAVMLLAVSSTFAVEVYSNSIDPMLEVTPVQDASEEETPRVTAVYGVTTDDYLPLNEARRQLRPNVRHKQTRASFDLPDAFYFIGGPIIILILLRVLVIFLNGFEERRKEEMRIAASEHTPGERVRSE